MSFISVNNPDSFKTYPNHRILGIIENREGAQHALSSLETAGLKKDDLELYYGEGGAAVIDADSEHHGVFSKIAAFLRSYGDVENEALHIYETALKQGKYVLAVPASSDAEKETIRKILVDNGARELNYFDTWVVEALEAA